MALDLFLTGIVYLSPAKRPSQVDGSDKSTVAIRMSFASGRHKIARTKIVVWPTGEYEDLEIPGLFSKQRTKPIHAVVVALNELVVQDNCRLQILRQREPVQGGQLLAGAD